ncbi:hypothetical protein KKE60_05740 [Patescibacteria group bacterium]|nr:hypothetical protein [Patescibacteria group bacterium]
MRHWKEIACTVVVCITLALLAAGVNAQEPIERPVPCPDRTRLQNGWSDTARGHALTDYLGTVLTATEWTGLFAAMYPEPPDNERINMLQRILRDAEDAHETDIADRARARIEALTPVEAIEIER